MMQKLGGAILIAIAVLATACGSAAVQTESATVVAPDDLSQRLIGHLGSDRAALDALIVAMAVSYTHLTLPTILLV